MDAYVGEIRVFSFGLVPRGWAQCNGQILPVAQNTTLFSLLGISFGGNGSTTFALPNLMGAVPVSPGQSPGGSQWVLGETTGTGMYTLLQAEMPMHNHGLVVTSSKGSQTSAAGAQLANGFVGGLSSATTALVYSSNGPNTPLAAQSIDPVGGNQPHNNMMPYLAVNFCICLIGEYPQRS